MGGKKKKKPCYSVVVYTHAYRHTQDARTHTNRYNLVNDHGPSAGMEIDAYIYRCIHLSMHICIDAYIYRCIH